jgi:protein phosphatase
VIETTHGPSFHNVSCEGPYLGGIIVLGMMDCCGLSDVGRVREHNEDQFLIADLKKSVIIHQTSLSYEDETELLGGSQAKLLLVADGVGGNAAGELASSLAIEGAVQYLLNMMHWLFRLETEREDIFRQDLKAALAFTQEKLQHSAESVPEQQGMGTTITMAYLNWPYVYLGHVGDSRAYIYRNRSLTRLTHDQTLAQDLADAGVIEADQVDDSPFSHVLSSLLGCDPTQLNPEVYKSKLSLHDKLLLCTDGLTRHLSDSDLTDILALDLSAEEACHQLIDTANEAGGTDNTTVVLAHFMDRRTAVADVQKLHVPVDESTTLEIR